MESASEILSDTGSLSKVIDSYKSRPMQQAMADTILKALLEDESVICEAGTGTGKTFAYLVPALMSDVKVIISTGTKHLQDQIFHRDLPTVHKALKSTSSIALLKGRGNYLCLHRHKFADEILKSPKLHTELHDIQNWVHKTETGDLTEVLSEDSHIKPWISSTTDNCLGQECSEYEDCFVLKARKRAAKADVIVVNHHLLLADMALRETGFGELLPNIDSIIFDEAHQLPELASQFFGTTFSARQCLDLSEDTRNAYQKEAWDIEGFMDKTYQIDTAIRNLRDKFKTTDLKIEWQKIIKDEKTINCLNELHEKLEEFCDLIESIKERGKELENCFQRAVLLTKRLGGLLESNDTANVKWIEIRGKGVFLHTTPLDISKEFQQRLKHYQCNTIYTSATLAVGEKFDHFRQQLGLDTISAHQWPSPFDYPKQTLMYLPTNLPLPSQADFTKIVVDKITPVLNASQGRAFLLFTSHRALKEAADIIKQTLKFPCFIQGDAPKLQLIESFRNSQNGLLLGTSSFWEGVDVKGEALSCVVIDKLPFAMPDDPVLKARGALMEQQGKNVFMEHQLPQAVISLRQGVGRLVRDESDTGVLVICDPRLTTKAYGRIFLKSLPNMTKTRNVKDIEAFFENNS